MLSSLVIFLASIAMFIGTIMSWSIYVEDGKILLIKKYMLSMLAIITLIEVYAYITGSVRSYFLPTVIMVNLWGYFDAIVRYPSVPNLETMFCAKTLLSVVAKTVAYSVGFVDIHKWVLVFLAALFMNVWLLPVLYILAVPYGDSSPYRKDRDVLTTIYLLVTDRIERKNILDSVFGYVGVQRASNAISPLI